MMNYIIGDALELLKKMPSGSIQCVVTSPPYYALRSYLPEGHPDKDLEIGSEPSLDAFVATMVLVFAEVRRVLRDDGTLWLNLGDGYSTGSHAVNRSSSSSKCCGNFRNGANYVDSVHYGARDLPYKNLMLVPARVALALQADGWILRSDIIWHKPNPMPESCRDRPTSAHEHMFMFAKRGKYFFDQEAVREPCTAESLARQKRGRSDDNDMSKCNHPHGRNLRNVWKIPTQAVKHKHYATFPERLVTPCVKAGTSEHGACSKCGAPYTRVIEKVDPAGRLGESWHDKDDMARGQRGAPPAAGAPIRTTVGWAVACSCDAPVGPSWVLDPFMGSGTVAIVADRLGRQWIGLDLDARNLDMCKLRLAEVKS